VSNKSNQAISLIRQKNLISKIRDLESLVDFVYNETRLPAPVAVSLRSDFSCTIISRYSLSIENIQDHSIDMYTGTVVQFLRCSL